MFSACDYVLWVLVKSEAFNDATFPVTCLDDSRGFPAASLSTVACQVGSQGICELFILTRLLICILTNIKEAYRYYIRPAESILWFLLFFLI